MILAIAIITSIAWVVFSFVSVITDDDKWYTFIGLCCTISIVFTIIGCVTGFVYHPPTEGAQQGVITAVDLEGVYFRRYEVYLKSSGYTTQSDETTYKIYDYETELAEELKSYIGKEVRLTYGHDGGYISWDSCGTYHIKSVELVEE